jgi:hypothetical protein
VKQNNFPRKKRSPIAADDDDSYNNCKQNDKINNTTVKRTICFSIQNYPALNKHAVQATNDPSRIHAASTKQEIKNRNTKMNFEEQF